MASALLATVRSNLTAIRAAAIENRAFAAMREGIRKINMYDIPTGRHSRRIDDTFIRAITRNAIPRYII